MLLAGAMAFALIGIAGFARGIQRGMIVVVMMVMAVAMEVAIDHFVAVSDLDGCIGAEGMHGAEGQNKQDVDEAMHEQIQKRAPKARNSLGWVKVIIGGFG